MAMLAPSGGGQAQMVLCGMVVNPDGTVAGAGPVGQLPPGTIPAGTLPPGTLAPNAAFPGTSQSALDPATIAAWGAATLMHGMAKGANGKGGMQMMQQPQQFQGQPQQFQGQPQQFQGQPGFSQSFSTHGKGAGGRNRGPDLRTESDWESLGRQRQTGVSEVPKNNSEGQNFQQNFGRNFSNFSSEGFQQEKGGGFSTFQTNTPAFSKGSGKTSGKSTEPKVKGRYSQPFADPTSEDDWALLGRQRENPEVPIKPFARSIHSIVEEEADEAREDEVDEDWNKLFESKGKGNETSKVFDSATLKELKLKVEKPVMTDMDRDADKDWAMPVPEEDLEWISAAAKAAEAALEEEKPIPVLGTREAIALAQREAEERYFASERLARRQQSRLEEEEPRNADEARHDVRAEEFREQQASEAKQERQLQIEEMKRQDQRIVEREAKLAGRDGAPKMSWAAARASRNSQGSQGSGGSTALSASDPGSYREQQAALARAERERELKLIASLHERDAEREARIMSRPTGGS